MNGGLFFDDADTSPILEGATYERTNDDGLVETGSIMGTKPDETSGRMRGWLYSFSRGPVPLLVVEGTESFVGWVLVAAPSKQSAKILAGLHKKAMEEAA